MSQENQQVFAEIARVAINMGALLFIIFVVGTMISDGTTASKKPEKDYD